MKKIVLIFLVIVINVMAVDVDKLLLAQEKAKIVYKDTKNVYPAIEILRDASIDKIIDNKPKKLSDKQDKRKVA
jgi:hypothetical protein